jgi:hypothetical protein
MPTTRKLALKPVPVGAAQCLSFLIHQPNLGLPKEPSLNRTMMLTDSSTAVVKYSGTNVPYMALQPGAPSAVRLGSYG